MRANRVNRLHKLLSPTGSNAKIRGESDSGEFLLKFKIPVNEAVLDYNESTDT